MGVGADKALWNAANAIWALGPMALLGIPLFGAVISILAFYFVCALIGLFSLFLGGKGPFKQNAYLVSRLIFPFSLVTIAIGFISQIPILGDILPLLWVVYALWIGVNVVNVANDLSLDKSAVVVAVIVGLIGLGIALF